MTDYQLFSTDAAGPLLSNLNKVGNDLDRFDNNDNFRKPRNTQAQVNAFNRLTKTINSEVNCLCAGANSGGSGDCRPTPASSGSSGGFPAAGSSGDSGNC